MDRDIVLKDLWPALIGGLVAIAGALLLRTLVGTRLLAEIALDATLSVMPGQDFSSLLGAFGPYGKGLFFASALLAQVAVYVAVWTEIRRFAGAQAPTVQLVFASALTATLIFLLAAVILISITSATLGNYTGWPDFALATLLLSAIYAAVAGLQSIDRLGEDAGSEADASRRAFLTRIPGVALGGLALLVIGRAINDATGGGVQRSRSGVPTPEVTPNEEFYLVSKNLIDPQPDAGSWRLDVGGATERTLTFTYDDMLAMPSQEQYTTMQCISNTVGGELISNALWRGVPLSSVIEQAGALPQARYIFFRCADEYTESLPLDFAMREQVMLVYQMNGVPLPSKHGFPIRLLAPGKYGVKHPKWITEITLLEDEQLGFWQKQGWSQEARMNTTVRIDVPGSGRTYPTGAMLVQGVAFSGDRGISRVEVSTDEGASWSEARLRPPLSPYTWVLWEYDWANPPPEGQSTLLARATDGTGQLQKADDRSPFPDGAAAYHRVRFRIEPNSA